MREMVSVTVSVGFVTVMEHAPACSAILAWRMLETWKMAPPRRVWVTPNLKEYGWFWFGSVVVVMTVVLYTVTALSSSAIAAASKVFGKMRSWKCI